MLKSLKKVLAALMVVIMMLTSIPLQGFVDLELPQWFTFEAEAIESPVPEATEVIEKAAPERKEILLGEIINGIQTVAPETDDRDIAMDFDDDKFEKFVISVKEEFEPIVNSAETIIAAESDVAAVLDAVVGGENTEDTEFEEVLPDDSGVVNETIFWTFEGKTKTLTISGEGKIPSYYPEFYYRGQDVPQEEYVSLLAPWEKYLTVAEKIVICEGITAIGDFNFFTAINVREITFGETLETIGDGCFGYVNRVEVLAFPSSLKYIGESCFMFPFELRELYLNEGLISVGGGCFFEGLLRLKKVYIPSTLEQNELTISIIGDGEITFNCKQAVDFEFSRLNKTDEDTESLEETIEMYMFIVALLTKYSYGFYNDFVPVDGIGDDFVSAFIDEWNSKYDEKITEDETEEVNTYIFLLLYMIMGSDDLLFQYCADENLIAHVAGDSAMHDVCREKLIKHTVGDSEELCECFTFEGTVSDTISYSVDTYTRTLIISGEGDHPDNSSYPYYAHLNDYVDYVVFSEDSAITDIGSNAFESMDIKEVTIPASVKVVRNKAFNNCRKLEAVNIITENAGIALWPESFAGCYSLKEIYLPEGVYWLSDNAFKNSGLEKITIRNNNIQMGDTGVASTIPYSAVIYCYSGSTAEAFANANYRTVKYLDEFTVDMLEFEIGTKEGFEGEVATVIGYTGKAASVEIPAEINGVPVVAIGNQAFYNNKYIETVSMSDSVIEIGYAAFYNTNLESIRLSKNIKTIGSNAFYNNYSSIKNVYASDLESWLKIDFYSGTSNPAYNSENLYFGEELVKKVVVPEGTTEIGDYAFYGYKGLTEVRLPSTLKTIGSSAFYNCNSLENVYASNLESWLCIDFNSGSSNPICYADNLKFGDELTSEIVIPEGTTEIKDYTFYGYKGLTEVSLPSTLESIGSYAFAETSLTKVVVPASVSYINSAFSDCQSLETVVFEEGITAIPDYALDSCTGLKNVTIPSSVEYISNGAFYGCEALENVYASDLESWIGIGFYYEDNNPLYYADNLYFGEELVTELVIPEGITEISDYAFYGYKGLTSVTLSSSIETIGYYAFAECSNIVKVCADSLSDFLSIVFYGSSKSNPMNCGADLYIAGKLFTDLVVTEDTPEIHDYAFSGCTSLESVKFIGGMTVVPGECFSGCTSLESVELNEGIETIKWSAFFNCSSLKKIDIPDTVTEIQSSAFYDCYELADVNIGANVQSIGDYAFYDALKIKSYNLPDTLTYIGQGAFWNNANLGEINIPDSVIRIEASTFRDCPKLRTVTLPSNLTYIGSYAFSNASSLESIVIPDSVTDLGYHAFSGCTDLVSAELGDGISYIESNLFYNCTSLVSIEIPSQVTEIGYSAFAGCTSLRSAVVDYMVEYISYNAFENCPNLTIYGVPGSYAESYANDNSIPFEIFITGVVINLNDENGESVTSGYSVNWYDAEGNLIATGMNIKNITPDEAYSYEIILDRNLSYVYQQFEPVSFIATDEIEIKVHDLVKLPAAEFKGIVTDGDGNRLEGVYIEIEQTFGNKYTKTDYCYTDENGGYTYSALQVPTNFIFSKEGYYDRRKSVYSPEGNGMTDVSVSLVKIPENKITLNLSLTSAVSSDGEPTIKELSNFNGLDFEVYNETRGEKVYDFVIKYPYIVLAESEADGRDEITISVTDRNKKMTAEPVTIRLDENRMGSTDIEFLENGKIQANVNFAWGGLAIIFDSYGNRVTKKSLYFGNYTSDPLTAGDYTVVFIKNSSYFDGVSKLSHFAELGIKESDYTKKTVTVENGKVVNLGEINIPVFDESKLYYTVADSTGIYTNETNVTAGKYITVKVQYKIDEKHSTSNERLIIEFPEGVEFVDNSLTLDSNRASYAYENGSVNVFANQSSGELRFYCVAIDEGTHDINAFIKFDSSDSTIMQPIGSAEIEATYSKLKIKEETKEETVAVSGTALPNSLVEVYADEELAASVYANAVGSWATEITLKNTHNYTFHDVYAKIISDKINKTVMTDTHSVLYNAGAVEIHTVTMYNTGDNGENVTVIDFINPTSGTPSYRMWPGRFTSFSFVADFGEDDARAKNVVLKVEQQSGKTRRLYMQYDSVKDAWIANTEFRTFDEAPVGMDVEFSYDMPEDFNYINVDLEQVKEDIYESVDQRIDDSWDAYDCELIAETEDTTVFDFTSMNDENVKQRIFISELDFAAYDLEKLENSRFEKIEEEDNVRYIGYTYCDNVIDGHGMYLTMEFDVKEETAIAMYFFVITDEEESNIMQRKNVKAVSEDKDFPEMDITISEIAENVNNVFEVIDGFELGYNIDKIISKEMNKELEKYFDSELLKYSFGISGFFDATEVRTIDKKRTKYSKMVADEIDRIREQLNVRCEESKELALPLDVYNKLLIAVNELATNLDATDKYYDPRIKEAASKVLLGTTLEIVTLRYGGIIKGKVAQKIAAIKKMNPDTKRLRYLLRDKKGGTSPEVRKMISEAIYDSFSTLIEKSASIFDDYFSVDAKQLHKGIESDYQELLKELVEIEIEINEKRTCEEEEEEEEENKLKPILDPSGYVYEAVPSNRVEGVKVEAYYYDYPLDEFGMPMEEKEEIFWDASEYDQINPLYTDVNGQYAWDVPPGQWLVKYSKDGYYDTDSRNDIAVDEDGYLPVPPPQVEVNTAIVSKAAPAVESVNVYSDSIQIIFSQYMKPATVDSNTVKVVCNGKEVTGTVTASNAEYNYEETEQFASVYTFTPESTLTGTVSVTVDGAVNYAGRKMAVKHSTSDTAEVKPEKINVPESTTIEYNSGSLAEISVYPAEAGANKTLTVTTSSPSIVGIVNSTVTTDADGKASIMLQGNLPGSAVITVSLDGTDISAEFSASVGNVQSSENKCEKVTASIPTGSKVAPGTAVTLTTATEGADIYYTLDGTCPCIVDSPSRILYTGPITVTEDLFIIAYAVKGDMTESATAGFVYTVDSEAGCAHGNLKKYDAVAAKCTEDGTVAYYQCKNCEMKFADENARVEITNITVKATGHSGGTANCKDKAKCAVCGVEYGSVNTNNHKSLTPLKAVPATCTKTGLTEGKKCSSCGKITVVQKTVPVVSHTEVVIPAKKATYKDTGLTEGKKCKVCGKITLEQKTVAKLKLDKVTGLKAKKISVAKSSYVTLAWNKTAGAQKYEVYQQSGNKWKKIKTTSSTSLKVKKLSAGKSYKFKVRAILSGEPSGKYSSVLTVKVVPGKTTLSVKAGMKQLTASWKSVSGVTGYEVQYSTSKKFTKKTTKTLTLKSKSKKTTLKKLSKGKKYYVRVRAYKKIGSKIYYGSYSTVKSVKVK